jgi:hypothetical protein
VTCSRREENRNCELVKYLAVGTDPILKLLYSLTADLVFLQEIANLNLSEMVSERLRAMRNLQENPNDANAKKKLDALQETVSALQ